MDDNKEKITEIPITQFEEKRETEILYETRSQEADEIIGKVPPVILRIGILIIAILLFSAYLIMALIKYPDIITASFRILITEVPQRIITEIKSPIAEIYVMNGEKISKNQPLILLEDSAIFEHVSIAQKMAYSIDTAIYFDAVIKKIILSKNLELGNLQPYYQDLIIAISDYKLFNLKSTSIVSDISVKQGIRSLAKKLIFKSEEWKNQHLILSPISGHVTFLKPLRKHLIVNQNELLMIVSPQLTSKPTTIGIVENVQSDKLRLGESVNLKLLSYPYQKYGVVMGRITNLVPIDSGRIFINVELLNGMKTNTNFTVPAQPQFSAIGEIITKNQTMLQRLLNIK